MTAIDAYTLANDTPKFMDKSLDLLSPLFARFTLTARVFYSGNLCNNVNFACQPGLGYLHVLQKGTLIVTHPAARPREISEPSLLFYAQPSLHGFKIKDPAGVKLVCASIDFGAAMGNPLLRGLPALLVVPLAKIGGIESTLALLFAEAFGSHAGRTAAIDRLSEYFLVLLMRHAIDAQLVNGGALAALADPRLAKTVHAMHAKPDSDWTLVQFASVAGMSRASFAALFRKTTGMTPMDYLTDYRVSIARTLLKRGKSLKLIAPQVGYTNPAALSRVFMQRIGASPAKWLAANTGELLGAGSPYADPVIKAKARRAARRSL
jgi:AraC-like DNA-binding protein